jgi:hypothetical protein
MDKNIGFNFISTKDNSITVMSVETYDVDLARAIIASAKNSKLLACFNEDVNKVPKIASAMEGTTAIRYNLPGRGLNFRDMGMVGQHSKRVVDLLAAALHTVGGWQDTELTMQGCSLVFHSPHSPVISGICVVVTVTGGPHTGKDISRMPLFVPNVPSEYALRQGTRDELGLPAIMGADPAAIEWGLKPVRFTNLTCSKRDIYIAYKAFCTTCRTTLHPTKGCERANRSKDNHYASYKGTATVDQQLARYAAPMQDHSSCSSDGGAWHVQGKRARN